MKAIDLSPAASKALSSLMLQGLGELNGRSLQQATGLETLGVLALRMLVAAEAITLPALVTEAVEQVSESALPVSLSAVRESMQSLFDQKEHLETIGITFHTIH